MTNFQQEDVIHVLNVLKNSDFDELQLECNGIKLYARKSSKEYNSSTNKSLELDKQTDDINEDISVCRNQTNEKQDHEIFKKRETQYENYENLSKIKASMLGTFYRAPEPGAEPFVKEGDFVKEDDPVCIIEVMKLYNTINAGMNGKIIKILVNDGDMVEYGQELFLVEPSDN